MGMHLNIGVHLTHRRASQVDRWRGLQRYRIKPEAALTELYTNYYGRWSIGAPNRNAPQSDR
jgi:hypothetical protein